MKKLITIVLISLCVTTTASAAVDMFLKIDGIDGESVDANHTDWIDVLSIDFGVHSTNGDPACTGGISITKFLDASSSPLVNAAGNEKGLVVLGNAVLVVRKSGGEPIEVLEYTMTGVRVTSYSIGILGGEARLTDAIQLAFDTLKGVYTRQNSDGSAGGTSEFNIAPPVCIRGAADIFQDGFENLNSVVLLSDTLAQDW